MRGFSDPRAIALPGGKPVWLQPRKPGDADTVAPFHLDTKTTYAQGMKSLDHSWKKSHELWKHHDAWIATKGEMTMGYFARADLPFYYALADAFTICDAYHCSIFAPTTPNRMFLFTGTSGLSVGDDGHQAVDNPPEEPNETADMANDAKGFAGFGWTTYAERLEAAGIDWRVYQEFDNYGDNALAYFAKFRDGVAQSDLHARARSWVPGSNAANAKTSRGEHLATAFAADVAADRLPQVSWIVPPYILCEHPSATPGYGESLTARLLEALASNPDVWAKTAFILNYDENDGFFDHVPPLVPAIQDTMGASTVDTRGEAYRREPVGFGPRVPLIVVSPWTRGGFVNSELSDHTSVIRFLEKRFGVMEPNTSPWRRAVAGDLTSMFDFTQRDGWAAVPGGGDALVRADQQASLPPAKLVTETALPAQEPGQRPARPLPYDFDTTLTPAPGGVTLTFVNRGTAGAGFIVYSARAGEGPWTYTVESGKTLRQTLAIGDVYDLSVHGANGFLRRFRRATGPRIDVALRSAGDAVILTLRNAGPGPTKLSVRSTYSEGVAHLHDIAEGAGVEDRWPIGQDDHWYDLVVGMHNNRGFLQQLAGHIETGRPSKSDPAIGRA